MKIWQAAALTLLTLTADICCGLWRDAAHKMSHLHSSWLFPDSHALLLLQLLLLQRGGAAAPVRVETWRKSLEEGKRLTASGARV